MEYMVRRLPRVNRSFRLSWRQADEPDQCWSGDFTPESAKRLLEDRTYQADWAVRRGLAEIAAGRDTGGLWVVSKQYADWHVNMWMEACLRGERAQCLEQLEHRRQVLFAAGCCRMVWDLLTEPCRRAVEATEDYVDRLLDGKKFQALRSRVAKHVRNQVYRDYIPRYQACNAASTLVSLSLLDVTETAKVAAGLAISTALAAKDAWGVVAEGVPNQFEEKQAEMFKSFMYFAIRYDWKTPVTATLAKATYEDPAAFPVLLDALEEAGIDVSEHRGVVFYKGNWLVDKLKHWCPCPLCQKSLGWASGLAGKP